MKFFQALALVCSIGAVVYSWPGGYFSAPTPKSSPVPTRGVLGAVIEDQKKTLQKLALMDCQLLAVGDLGCTPKNPCVNYVYEAYVFACMKKIKGYPDFGTNCKIGECM